MKSNNRPSILKPCLQNCFTDAAKKLGKIVDKYNNLPPDESNGDLSDLGDLLKDLANALNTGDGKAVAKKIHPVLRKIAAKNPDDSRLANTLDDLSHALDGIENGDADDSNWDDVANKFGGLFDRMHDKGDR